jgi:hypothetical protein
MRFFRVFFALLPAVALAACSDISGKATAASNPPLAYVRYFNAVGDTLPLDFRPIDQIEYSTPFLAVPYRGIGIGNYQGYQATSRHIRVFPNSQDFATTSSILVDTTMSLTAGTYYTVVHTGYARAGASPKQGLMVLTDVFPAAGANVAIRVLNAGPDLGNVDVYITATATEPLPATPTFANVNFKGVSAYTTRAPGPIVMRVYAAGTTTTALVTATASAGTVGTSTANPIPGSGVAGTIYTAMIYSKAVLGSSASVTAGTGQNTAPSLVYWVDKLPPLTAP